MVQPTGYSLFRFSDVEFEFLVEITNFSFDSSGWVALK